MTADEARKMDAIELTNALAKAFGKERLPVEIEIKIAMLCGAGEKGIGVCDPGPGGGMWTEVLDYEKIAEILTRIETRVS